MGKASSLLGSVLNYSWQNLTDHRDLSFTREGQASRGAHNIVCHSFGGVVRSFVASPSLCSYLALFGVLSLFIVGLSVGAAEGC